MAVLGKPQPVQLVMGVIFRDAADLDKAASRLEAELGEIDLRSGSFDFDVTDYYGDEMGPGLKRVFLSFKNLFLFPFFLPLLFYFTKIINHN